MITNYLDTVNREWHFREPQGVMDYVHPLRAVCTHDLTDCSFAHEYDATRGRLCPDCKAAQGWTWEDPR
jgi:hypothetical protein